MPDYRFSIIIPTHNRPESLSRCLAALAVLDYPADAFEVIVVEDGASHRRSVQGQKHQHLSLRWLSQQQSGPAKARNLGASCARGTILAFTDDDCCPAPNWLCVMEDRFGRRPHCALGGPLVNALSDNLYSTASDVLLRYLMGVLNHPQPQFLPSANLAVPREDFLSIGGFDESFSLAAAEDREFCERWLHEGHPLVFASDLVVFHSHCLKMSTFLRQHFNYGRGAYHLRRIDRRRRAEATGLQPLGFYLNLLGNPLSMPAVRRPWTLVLLMFLSQLATGLGYLLERLKPASLQPGTTG